jgi:hypothetical protein
MTEQLSQGLLGSCLVESTAPRFVRNNYFTSVARTAGEPIGCFDVAMPETSILEYDVDRGSLVASFDAVTVNVEVVSDVLLRVRTSVGGDPFDVDFYLRLTRSNVVNGAETPLVPAPTPPGGGGTGMRSHAIIQEDFFPATSAGQYNWFEEIDGGSDLTAVVSGNLLTLPDEDHPGQLALSEGDTGVATGWALTCLNPATSGGLGAFKPQFTLDLTRADELYMAWMIRFTDLSVAANRFILQLGLRDTIVNGDPNTGLVLEYTDDVNGGAWRGRAFNGGLNSNVNGAVPAVADTWTLLEAIVSDGVAEFFVDGASLGTINANLPTAPNLCAPCALIDRTSQTANEVRTLLLDFCMIRKRVER